MLRDAHRTIKPLACPRAPHVEDDDGQPLDGFGTSMPRPTLPTLPGVRGVRRVRRVRRGLHLRPPRRRWPVPVPSTIPGRIPRRSAPPRARVVRRVPTEEREVLKVRGTQRSSKGTQTQFNAVRGNGVLEHDALEFNVTFRPPWRGDATVRIYRGRGVDEVEGLAQWLRLPLNV